MDDPNTIITTIISLVVSAIVFLYKRDARRSDEAIEVLSERSDNCDEDRIVLRDRLDDQQTTLVELKTEIKTMKTLHKIDCPKDNCPRRDMLKDVDKN